MAKRHLKELFKLLNLEYKEAEKVYTKFAEQTEKMIISDESLDGITKQKVLLDNLLSTYSAGISEAYGDRLNKLIETETRIQKSFNEPLLQIMDNLSSNPKDIASQELLSKYTGLIKKSKARERVLLDIKFFKDLPNRKKKEKLVLNKTNMLGDISELYDSYLICHIRKEIEKLTVLQEEFLKIPIKESDKGDLDE